jgi:hypothetical protein
MKIKRTIANTLYWGMAGTVTLLIGGIAVAGIFKVVASMVQFLSDFFSDPKARLAVGLVIAFYGTGITVLLLIFKLFEWANKNRKI